MEIQASLLRVSIFSFLQISSSNVFFSIIIASLFPVFLPPSQKCIIWKICLNIEQTTFPASRANLRGSLWSTVVICISDLHLSSLDRFPLF